MALNIKDDETDRLARELAAATGESITLAARVAITERLARVRRARQRDIRHDAVTDIIARGRARTTLTSVTEDDILGYGHDGLPH